MGPCRSPWECVRSLYRWGFPGGTMVKTLPGNAGDAGDPGLVPGLGRSPAGGHGNPLQYLAWRIPWTEEPGVLQSMGSQRFRHNWVTNFHLYFITLTNISQSLCGNHIKLSSGQKKKLMMKLLKHEIDAFLCSSLQIMVDYNDVVKLPPLNSLVDFHSQHPETTSY